MAKSKQTQKQKPKSQKRKVVVNNQSASARLNAVKRTVRRSTRGAAVQGQIMALDARRPIHVPPPFPMGPYTVLRGRTVLFIQTSTTGANTVVLIGPHRIRQTEASYTPLVAITGQGTAVPGTTESYGNDNIVVPYTGTGSITDSLASGCLHAITATVQCTNSATAAMGVVYAGALHQRVGRTNFSTWNNVASALLQRREMQSVSAYNTMTKPLVMSSYPIDMVEWATQCPLVPTNASLTENYSTDTMAQLALVFPPTTTAVDYNVTIHTEWRINFVDAVLSSTSIKREPSQVGWWNKAISMASNASGFLENAAHVGSELGAAVQAYRGIANSLGQLGNMARPLLAIA